MRELEAALRPLIKVVELFHPEVSEHSRRVADFAYWFASRLELDQRDCRILWFAGMLHDLGKLAVADVVGLPRGLSSEEKERVMTHPVLSYEVLKAVEGLPGDLMDAVLYHHERWDGRGYPTGLVGAAIPFAARVLCICDAYDAMTSKRAYRNAFSTQVAAEQIRFGAGQQFDPMLAEKFLEVVSRKTVKERESTRLQIGV